MATPASAKILKTIRQALETQEHTLTVGSGFEFQSDVEEAEYDFPFLLEYGLSDRLKLTVEPNLLYLHRAGKTSVGGFGEMETSVTYDLLAERRNRPGFSALGIVKWPTASHADLGTGKTDYTLGLIVSKEFVHADLEFNGLYTFVGSPPGTQLQNTIEGVLSGEWHFSRVLDFEAEVDAVSGAGRSHGQATIVALGNQVSKNEVLSTLGIAEHLSKIFKLEEGIVIGSDGSLQGVFAWEWNIQGD